MGTAATKKQKVGQKAAVNTGQVVAHTGIVTTQLGKALQDDRVSGGIGTAVTYATGDEQKGYIATQTAEDVGATMESSGRVMKHSGRGLKQLGRGHGKKSHKQGIKSEKKAEKVDLERAARGSAGLTLLFG